MIYIETINYEKLLELPNDMVHISESNSYLSLLSDEFCNKYYYTQLKSDLKKIIKKFNDIKYFDIADNLKATNYEINADIHANKNSDKILNYIINKIDNETYLVKIYNLLKSLSYKFTLSETIYFVETFFSEKTDDAICERLGLSRTGIQKIRKSCLVKTYLEFKKIVI